MYDSPSDRRFSKTRTGAGEDRRSLRELASDLARIAEQISAVAHNRDVPPDSGEFSAAQVQALLDGRLARAAAIGLDLVHPGWTLLLVLYRAHLDGRPIRMARLATEAHVAMTTMMRWLAPFLAHGLAERRPDPNHGRGVLITVTADGAKRIGRQLKEEMMWMGKSLRE